jgi:hypothetical protein
MHAGCLILSTDERQILGVGRGPKDAILDARINAPTVRPGPLATCTEALFRAASRAQLPTTGGELKRDGWLGRLGVGYWFRQADPTEGGEFGYYEAKQ